MSRSQCTTQGTKTLTVIFAGGGTGGHIYPAIAIAESLTARIKADHPDCTLECMFLCSDRAIDARILSQTTIHGSLVSFISTRAKPMSLKPRGLVTFLRSWRPTVRDTRSIIRDAREKSAACMVVATGGFVAAPVVAAACKERVAVAMCALDAVQGKANQMIERLLTKHGGNILDATLLGQNSEYESSSKITAHRVGPLMRSAAIAPGDQRACKEMLDLDPDAPVLAIIGGSAGAASMNAAWIHLLETHGNQLQSWQVLHQARANEHMQLRAAYTRAGITARVAALFDPMGQVWGAADLVLSRAGAGSVAEIAANNTPAVFVPYPYHRDRHQWHNAQILVDRGTAVIVEETIGDVAASAEALAAAILPLLADRAARELMRSNRQATSDNGADIIGHNGADAAAKCILSSLNVR